MSLTSHLDDHNSPVRRFLFERFPNIAPTVRGIRTRLAGVSTIRPIETVPWGVIGTAFDYRVRAYFAVTPLQDLVAWQGIGLFYGAGGLSIPEVLSWEDD